MLEQPQDDVKYLVVSRHECELILDSFKITSTVTGSRSLALKAAGLVLEWAAEDGVKEANRYLEIARAYQDAERRRDSLDAPLD